MKKKLLIASAALAAVLLAGAAVLFFWQSRRTKPFEPPAQMTCIVAGTEEQLTYEKTTDLAAERRQTGVNDVTISILAHTYLAESGAQYLYDNQGRLYAYFNFNRVPAYQAPSVTEENCRTVMEKFLADNHIDSSPYTEEELISNMQYKMSVPENGDQINWISATFSSDGTLIGATLYNNGIKTVSDADKADLDRQLEDYLAESGYTDTITEQTVSYRRVENILVAYYALVFKDNGGGVYAESFTLGKEKRFW